MEEVKPILTSFPQPPMPPQREPGFDFSKLILPGAILIAAIMISGSILYARLSAGQALIQQQAQGDTTSQYITVGTDDDPVLGDPNAPVTMIEFSDFQCPYCRAFWRDTLPLIKQNYVDTGKVKLVYRDFPLSIHPNSMLGAQAADCAIDQGKFWQMHDEIFSEQDKQGVDTIPFTQADTEKWAAAVGLNVGQFHGCVTAGNYTDEINKDIADGTAAGVDGTPTFSINGLKVVGAQPYAVFQSAIEQALQGSK